MNAKSAKAKGKLLEDYVADQIVAKGLDRKAHRDGGSGAGNREKADISTSMMVLGQNAGIECKNQAILCIPEWWRQTQKLESLGMEPILAFKQYGEPLSETKVVIYLETFLELVRKSSYEREIIKVPEEDSREKRYAIENLKRATAQLLKYYQ